MSGEEPLVSVIIPHLNQPDSAAICLASIFAQEWPADQLEVIFVDNGSRSDLAGLKAKFPTVTFLDEAQPGPGCARNAGVARARGSILAFIDADCRADGGWVSAAVRGVTETGSPVGGDVRIDFVDPGDPSPLEAFEAVFAYRQKLYIGKKGFSGTGNLAMTPEMFRRVGPFGGIDIAEDRDWGQRARAAGYRLHYRSDMIVYHPARRAMEELRLKWRRHIAHDYVKAGGSGLRWSAHIAAVALSIPPHALRQLGSSRVATLTGRARGLGVLLKIRAWRVAEMIRQTRGNGNAARSWNRD